MNRLLQRALAGVAVAVAVFAVTAQPASAADISSSGPLTRITVSPDLNCQVNHRDDSSGEWFSDIACGTLLTFDGVLYGPANIPAGGNATPRVGWTPVSQSAVSGAGTAANPYSVTTVVAAGQTGLELTQTDSYVLGNEHYQTKAVVRDTTGQSREGIIYTAGDCYLQSSDSGYGRVTGTSPACLADDSPTSRVEQLLPRTPGNTYMEGQYSAVWAAIGTQNPLPNTILDETAHDNGMAIAWPYSVPADGSRTFEWTTLFSPSGMVPVQTSVSADESEVSRGETAGYTIDLENTNAGSATVTELRVTLPDGFTYVPGSTSGLTTTDPTVSGNVLIFTGPFSIPSAGNGSVHFEATADADPGTYRVDVEGESSDVGILGVTDSAPVTVGEAPAAADLKLTKTASPSPAVAGAELVYTITVTNDGDAGSRGPKVTDTLPSQLTDPEVTSDDAICRIYQGTVTCDLADLAPDARAVITVTGIVNPAAADGSTIRNSASVVDDSGDPVEATATTTVTTVSEMTVSKQARQDEAAPGEEVTWDIVIVNNGPSNLAAGATLNELPEAQFTVASITGPAGTSCTTSACTLPELAAGDEIHLVAIGTVSASAPDGEVTNSVELDVSGSIEAGTSAAVTVTAGSDGLNNGTDGDDDGSGGGSGSGGGLASTGITLAPMVAVATLLLLGGAGVVLMRRRSHS